MNAPFASVTVPGSKSLSNRALLLAGLSPGTSVLRNVLLSDDTEVMLNALKGLGVKVQQDGTTVTIESEGKFKAPAEALYLGNAGTAVRFLTATLSHQQFSTRIEGDPRMHERPIQDLVEALAILGAEIETQNGCPPLAIHGKPLTGDHTSIQGQNSSQYISALMILAPQLPRGLTLEIQGEATSKPYLDITLDLMKKFGIKTLEREAYRQFRIPAHPYHPTELTIEADASSATYFFGLAAITGQRITVNNTTRSTRQPDILILDQLEKMGALIKEDDQGITTQGPSRLKALGTVDCNAFPDGAMTLAAVAACAEGETTLTGLHNLRIKECDRLQALETELNKINVQSTTTQDSITIQGNPDGIQPASIATYNDHRMAMCFGMLRERYPQLQIENPSCVNKTYPQFWNDLQALKLDS